MLSKLKNIYAKYSVCKCISIAYRDQKFHISSLCFFLPRSKSIFPEPCYFHLDERIWITLLTSMCTVFPNQVSWNANKLPKFLKSIFLKAYSLYRLLVILYLSPRILNDNRSSWVFFPSIFLLIRDKFGLSYDF